MHADSVLRSKYNLPDLNDFEQWLAPKIQNNSNQRNIQGRFAQDSVYTIPVIVHVVHNGDAVGSNENISAAQVYSQIDILNRDFRRLNPDTGNAPAAFQAVGADAGIEFCIAQIDPNGNVLAEPGINRYNGGQATWSDTDIDNILKPATIWDPDRYFNIWVVDFGNTGLLGYAQFPSSSGLGGMPANGGPANTDGIVCLYRAFGNTGNVSSPSNGGRTATHEAGHWFGLRHIWGDGGCGADDFCADTPESDAANRGCSTTSSCNSQDMIQNYMDYTNDACMNIFTQDQVARMRTVMLNSPRRGVLVNSAVCQALDQYTLSGQVRDASNLNGIPNANVLISGSFDYSLTTDAQGNFSIDVFEGTYDIYGGKWGYVTNVNSNVSVLANTGPVYIDLDAGWYDDFLFDFNWTENGTATTGNWERGVPVGTTYNNDPCNPGADVSTDYGEIAYVTGNGGGSAGTDDVDNGNTVLTSPVFDLSTYSDPYIQYYRWFYNSGGTGTPNDSLIVRLTNGITTQVIDVLDVNSPNSNQWNYIETKVSDYMSPTANMQLIVETFDKPSVGHLVEAGLDLFRVVDSIVNQNAPPVVNFNATSRTICVGDTVNFMDLSSNLPTGWSWVFQGGLPASSSIQTPYVVYNTPGVYNVTLTATNVFGQATKTDTAYITVQGVTADFTANINAGCPGISVQFTDLSTCGVSSRTWSFPGGIPTTSSDPNPVVVYNSVGDFDVSLTVNGSNSTDTKTLTSFISIGTGPVNVFFEDFESDDFATNNWTVENPDNDVSWEIYPVGGALSGAYAAGINFYSYNNAIGEEDGLVTPVLNLSNVINTELSFDHAHRRYSQNQQDSLKILVSTDGGNTYPNVLFARAEDGSGSFATNSTTTVDFYPTTNDDWCFSGNIGSSCFTLDLSAFDRTNNVRVKFLSVNDYGNNLYIDNIDISGECTVIDSTPVAIFISNLTSICEGDTVNFTDVSQNNPDTWDWSFPGGTPTSFTSQNPNVVYYTQGSYPVTLIVSNSRGRDSVTLSSYITVSENPSVTLSGDQSLCSGDSTGTVSANVGGGNDPYSYEWNTGSISNMITGLGAGIYSVTVTDSNSCIQTATYSISSNSAPSVQLTVVDADCNGASTGAASLNPTGNGPFSYMWSNGNSNSINPNLSAGTYYYTVTDSNGCINTDVFNVGEPAAIQIADSITAAGCGQADGSISVVASGGTSPFTYLWSNGQGGGNIGNLSAGNYDLTVTDAMSCNAIGTYTVNNIGGANVIALPNNVSCSGAADGSVDLSVSGGAPPYTYIWSNDSITQNISNLGEGTYSVTVTDTSGCLSITSAVVSNPNPLLVNLSKKDVQCGEKLGEVIPQMSGGTAPYNFTWSDGSSDSVFVEVAGTYQLTVTDANSCTVLDTVSIEELNLSVVLDIAADSGLADGSVLVDVSGGTPPYSYHWLDSTLSGNSAAGLSADTYVLIVRDSLGCNARVEIEIPLFSSVELFSGDNISLSLYPNPSNGVFVLELDAQDKDLNYELYNTLGKQIVEGQINAGTTMYNFDYRQIASGVYFMRFRNSDIDIVKKVIFSNQ